MKASKLVLTIFLGCIFIIAVYVNILSVSAFHDRGTRGEVHYIPFEVPFKHLVVEDGWQLSAYIGDDPELAGDMLWFSADEVKVKEIKTKLAPNGMLMTKYYPGYDDELLSRIEIKNDTLFFRKLKRIGSSIRSIRMNLIGLSSVDISGKSTISLNSKKDYSTDSPFNMGRFTVKTSQEARVVTNWLSFDKLTVSGKDFSNVSLLWMYRKLAKDAKEVSLDSDIKLSGNAELTIYENEVSLTDYEIKNEAVILHQGKSVETVYGKKFSKYYTDFNKQTNASSTSSN